MDILPLVLMVWMIAMIPFLALTILGFGIFWYVKRNRLTDNSQTIK